MAGGNSGQDSDFVHAHANGIIEVDKHEEE